MEWALAMAVALIGLVLGIVVFVALPEHWKGFTIIAYVFVMVLYALYRLIGAMA